MYIRLKRIIDFFLALFSLIFFSPIFLVLSIWIKIDSKGPVFFKQKRVGINKSIFWIYKFRTMKEETPSDMPTHLFDGATNYITKSGEILRKTSLDELPQLINVLKGEMSLVGPRPALWNQYDLIEEREKFNANSVLPGLTGLAQINGRDELPIKVKARYDGEYVRKMNLFLDLKCIIYTVISVFKRDGIVEGKID